MFDQRKVVVYQRTESETWLSSSKEFAGYKNNFAEAESNLETLKLRGVISSWQHMGEKTVIIEAEAPWATIEDNVLHEFLPGLCGSDCDFAVHDRLEDEPRRKFKMRSSPFPGGKVRDFQEIAKAHA